MRMCTQRLRQVGGPAVVKNSMQVYSRALPGSRLAADVHKHLLLEQPKSNIRQALQKGV